MLQPTGHSLLQSSLVAFGSEPWRSSAGRSRWPNARSVCEAAAVESADFLSMLTHYHRPFSRPLLSLSTLSDTQIAEVLDQLGQSEPLPYRLTQPAYLPERRRIEQRMRARFLDKSGRPELHHPHYFVLGEFSLWETDGSLKVNIPLQSVPPDWVSFTLTDSFFNYRQTNLRGIPIPRRAYHQELFTLAELPLQLAAHDLPTNEWRSDPERRFETYVEAQIWSDEPVRHLRRGA